jgi:hypothetical protein
MRWWFQLLRGSTVTYWGWAARPRQAHALFFTVSYDYLLILASLQQSHHRSFSPASTGHEKRRANFAQADLTTFQFCQAQVYRKPRPQDHVTAANAYFMEI